MHPVAKEYWNLWLNCRISHISCWIPFKRWWIPGVRWQVWDVVVYHFSWSRGARQCWLTHLVEADIDWSDVRSADCSHREEALFPATDIDGALVEVKDSLQPVSDTWIDAEQLTWTNTCGWLDDDRTRNRVTDLLHINSRMHESHATSCK